jgi:hypothetical protein
MRWLAAILVAVFVTGCYGGSAGPTPGDMVDVLGELSAHGATMTDTVAGDAGCADQTLVDNARRLAVSYTPDDQTYTIYLFRWLNNSDYGEAAPAFSGCVAAYGQAHPNATVETVDVSPWRAFGPAWSPQLRDAVAQALTAATNGK